VRRLVPVHVVCRVSCSVMQSVLGTMEEAAFVIFVNRCNVCKTLIRYSELAALMKLLKSTPMTYSLLCASKPKIRCNLFVVY
jgi:hypothetical protein